jgi:hypothetical protein
MAVTHRMPQNVELNPQAYPADRMESWRIGDEARNPRNDYPELIQRVEDTKENKQEQRQLM